MRVWVVCDNNKAESILLFKTLILAEKYVDQYEGIASQDCWLLDKSGTQIKEKIKNETTTTKTKQETTIAQSDS